MKFRNYIWFILIAIGGFSCNPSVDNTYLNEIKAWQDTINLEFKDTAESPLTKEDYKIFEGLDFFAINPKYRIMAHFVSTPEELPFGMKTTTERLPIYVKYGEAYFMLDGVKCKLNIYQNQELIKREEYRDYLFIPYLDETSGKESYGGGKYLDLRIPSGDSIMIDFNKAYNPYCAYNHHYSCPIPPYENSMKVAVKAGVKAYNFSTPDP